MANQVATGAGKAFAFGTGAGGGSHLADQEAPGKVFAYGMGAGGRSHGCSGGSEAESSQRVPLRHDLPGEFRRDTAWQRVER